MRFADNRNRQCGNVRVGSGVYAYASPRDLVALRNPALAEYFEARLRGERPNLPTDVVPTAPQRVLSARPSPQHCAECDCAGFYGGECKWPACGMPIA